MPLLGFLGATASGTSDPIFGKDVSFYLLALPWYDAVVGLIITILVITIAFWAVIGLGLYPRSGRPWDLLADYHLRSGSVQSLRVIDADDAVSRAQSAVIWQRWLRQGLVLGMLLCLSSGASRFLDRYHLIIDGHSQVVAGASFADLHFWIPAYNVIVADWIGAAFILLAAACVTPIRTWFLTRPSHWIVLCGLFAALYLGAVILPPAVERLYVGPNQITLEQPYLLRSIAGTREAYNLDGASVEEREFAVSAAPLTREDLDKNGRNAARRPHLGLASARTPTPADPGLAAVLHLCRRRHRPLHDRWRRTAGHDHGA